jgi:hypothetical protein
MISLRARCVFAFLIRSFLLFSLYTREKIKPSQQDCCMFYLDVEVSVIKEPQRGAYIAAISKLGDLAQRPDPLVVEVEVRPLGDLTLLLAHP